mmetsp:Transcript_37957/g.119797  ORF Transcript_37957/g.119797 Transcript_37957/m.119797 type:complete len:269 (+) Transcript_37957:732-1538(+)
MADALEGPSDGVRSGGAAGAAAVTREGVSWRGLNTESSQASPEGGVYELRGEGRGRLSLEAIERRLRSTLAPEGAEVLHKSARRVHARRSPGHGDGARSHFMTMAFPEPLMDEQLGLGNLDVVVLEATGGGGAMKPEVAQNDDHVVPSTACGRAAQPRVQRCARGFRGKVLALQARLRVDLSETHTLAGCCHKGALGGALKIEVRMYTIDGAEVGLKRRRRYSPLLEHRTDVAQHGLQRRRQGLPAAGAAEVCKLLPLPLVPPIGPRG